VHRREQNLDAPACRDSKGDEKCNAGQTLAECVLAPALEHRDESNDKNKDRQPCQAFH
jgi:hypothetical protein